MIPWLCKWRFSYQCPYKVEEGVIIKNERRVHVIERDLRCDAVAALAPRGWMNGDVTDKKETRNTACDVRDREWAESPAFIHRAVRAAGSASVRSRPSSLILAFKFDHHTTSSTIYLFICWSELNISLRRKSIILSVVRPWRTPEEKKKKVGFRMRCNVFGKKEKSWRTAIDRYTDGAVLRRDRLSISLTRHRREATSHSVLRLAEKK